MNGIYNASPNQFEFQQAFHQYIILTRIISGPGCVSEVGAHAEKLKGTHALVVTDPVISKLGLTEPIIESLQKNNIETIIFNEVEENPHWQTIDKGGQIIKENNCDIVIAIGGGSSIDAAKSMAMMGTNEGSILDWEGIDLFPNDPIPFMVVPTTCGTGSEVTRGSVITESSRSRKLNVGSDRMRANVAFLDPLMLANIPASVASATGVDALTHAIEGYVSNIATPLTDSLLIGAIKLISDNLRSVVADPKNVTTTLNMQFAATIAGMGFNNAQLGIVHAMSEPLSPVAGVPHGVANAILLPHCMEFNLNGRIEKFAQIAEAMGENVEGLPKHIAAEKSLDAVRKLVEDVGIPSGLADVGVKEEHISPMVDQAKVHGLLNFNPRRVNAKEIEDIYRKSL
ncbi:iron-containing alcohol dehydrogenase [Oceanobacillus damuensis]|uniref:iron-containing alcohol dehydrogenase n=1 Tax=Oceanobacillus damuensis TaxID=937928 RepID=UPI000830BCB5|nr:iron-containing alcohol dehydrogenase [Oceanobacillus damuensis]